MYCPNCGKEIPDDAVFCPECGQMISSLRNEEDVVAVEPGIDSNKRKYCPNCGELIPDDADFCPECGQAVSIQIKQSDIEQKEPEKDESIRAEISDKKTDRYDQNGKPNTDNLTEKKKHADPMEKSKIPNEHEGEKPKKTFEVSYKAEELNDDRINNENLKDSSNTNADEENVFHTNADYKEKDEFVDVENDGKRYEYGKYENNHIQQEKNRHYDEDDSDYRSVKDNLGDSNANSHHVKNNNTPILIVLTMAAAAALAFFAVWFVQNNSISKVSTNTKSAVASTMEKASAKKAESSKEKTIPAEKPTQIPADLPKTTPTITPTATPAPTETPTPTPTQSPQIIVVAPRATPVPTTPPPRIYISADYVFPYSDTYLLTERDLAGKSAWELTIGRNEICARHGYIFNREDLQNYFNSKDWYYPVGQFDLNSVLSSTELRNMSFIDKYQNAHGLQTN